MPRLILLCLPPLVTPFALIALLRAVFWAAGAEWSEPGLAATYSLVFGIVIGAVISALLSGDPE